MKHIDETFFQSTEALSRRQGESLAKMISFLIPDAAVFTVDHDRKINYWSKGAEKLLGFTAAELNGEICLSGNRCPECMKGCGLHDAGKVEGMPLALDDIDGQPKPVTKYAMAYVQDNGKFNGGLEILLPRIELDQSQDLEAAHFAQYGLISQSNEMRKVFHLIQRVSQTDMPVLIRGDSGTGKELVARAIHGESNRKHQPFIAINCATLSDGLMESELFGHVKGAFTGAIRNHAGVFERAKGGTLFLDEIAELPYELQAKLLRVLETGDFIPVGAEQPVKADVRIVTATHKALREQVKAGEFRQDLLYRLRVIPIFLPRLQERQCDIPILIKQMLTEQFTNQKLPTVSPPALDKLMQYAWPGNVRELKNAIHYALVMFDGETINTTDLPPEVLSNQMLEKTVLEETDGELNQENLLAKIEHCNGNLSLAAKRLGISRTTLWRYRKKLQK